MTASYGIDLTFDLVELDPLGAAGIVLCRIHALVQTTVTRLDIVQQETDRVRLADHSSKNQGQQVPYAERRRCRIPLSMKRSSVTGVLTIPDGATFPVESRC